MVKGLGVEKIIESKVNIFTEGDKICKVEDRWNGQLPEGPFKTVSELNLVTGLWHVQLCVYLCHSLTDFFFPQAMRNLNSVVVPAFVNVPKSEEEEAAKKQS